MTEGMTAADEAASFATSEAIAATLQRYIDGARTGDNTLLRSAFLDTAHIRGSFGGKPVDLTLDQFCAAMERGGPASDLTARPVAIDHNGNAAMARVECLNWRGIRYTDFFVLLNG